MIACSRVAVQQVKVRPLVKRVCRLLHTADTLTLPPTAARAWGELMAIIQALYADNFYFGDAVVLLSMDRDGVQTFNAAVRKALATGAARLQHGDITHEIVVQADAADVEFHDGSVIWRLSPATADEISQDLNILGDRSKSGHHYVDLISPAETLVLSRDEYVGRV